MAKTSRSNSAPGVGAVSVVSGSIRTADDPTALDVKISIWDTEVTMRADGSELGHWPTHSVAVTPIDAFTFEFSAEGDRLVFTPDNPDEFKQHPIVAGSSKSKRKRRRKKADALQDQAAAQLRWDEETQAELDMRSRRTKTKKEQVPRPSRQERKATARRAKEAAAAAGLAQANQAPLVDYDNTEPKPSRQERKAAARRAKEAATAAASAQANQAPVVDYDNTEPKPSRRDRRASRQSEPVGTASAVIDEFETPRVEKPKKVRKPRRVKEPRPRPEKQSKADSNGHSRLAEMRHRAWISSLDFARQYDLFGLDRVPVHVEQRDEPTHQHTWSHRVAPASGPSSFICTLCGAFKKRGS